MTEQDVLVPVTTIEAASERAPSKVKARPAWHRLGFHRGTAILLACQLTLVVLSVGASVFVDLDYRPWTGVPLMTLAAISLLVWLYLVWEPGRTPNSWMVAETFLLQGLMFTLTLNVGPAQYFSAALNRPLIDDWLIQIDRWLGISVPDLVAWTATHPALVSTLTYAYWSLIPQLLFSVLTLGFLFRDRAAVWEYAFHFHVCMVITITALAIWPAACVFTTQGFESLIDQTRFINHFHGLRDGTFRVVDYNDVEGLVSVPSFHLAGAWMVTWVFRRYRLIFPVLLVVNGLLVASTVLLGAHYFADLLISAPMCWASVVAFRRWGSTFLAEAVTQSPRPSVAQPGLDATTTGTVLE